jgi:TPR repeat protein
LPTLSGSVGQPAPANEQIAAIRVAPITTAAVPAAREATPVAPTREAIAVAYQSAVQGQPEIRQPAAPALATPPPRRIDPDELATLLKRARDLINLGDIVPARLLLRRAADANEATAALILAQTYDPAVLGTTDARSIAADPATARHWYEKAASFGSQEAQQRLGQM